MKPFLHNVKYMVAFAWEAQPFIFIALILLQVVQGMMPLASAGITKALFDQLAHAFQNNADMLFVQSFMPLLVLQWLVAMLSLSLAQMYNFFNAEMGRRLDLNTQVTVYRHLNNLHGLAYFEQPEFHDMMRMAAHGLHNGPSKILETFANAVRNIIILLSFLGALLFLSPILALLLVVASLPQIIAQLKIGQQRFGLMFANTPAERKASYLGQILSHLRFAKELRLFNLGDYFLNQFADTTRSIHAAERHQQLREVRWHTALGLLTGTVGKLAFVVVILQAFDGRITLGDVALYTGAIMSVQGAIASLIRAGTNLNEQSLFFARFRELINLKPALAQPEVHQPIPPLQSGIEFRNVSFRYSSNHPWVLRDVNLFLPRGKCLALVGLNGAGKTTLVKLLTRLYDPTAGQILWDGVDIREFDVHQLRARTGVILQDFVQYDLSARENIGLGNIHQIDNLDAIKKAAMRVELDTFIRTLPRGYQTTLSRWLVEDGDGADLSGGEWQKIATARMLMRDADFLILDEPTAALDAKAEYDIYRQFATLTDDRTSLLISHRFSTVRIADYIAVLEDGRITEYGTHDDLLASEATYAHLYTMQADQYAQPL